MTRAQQLTIAVLVAAGTLVIAAAVAADTALANLARNSSMEDGADDTVADWRFWGWAPEGELRTAKGFWDKTISRTGAASLKIINAGPKDVGTWTNRRGDGFIPVEPGKTYTVSAWMMVESVDDPVRTHFRCGFCTIDAEGKPTYFPAETRVQIDPTNAAFTEAGVWKRVAVTARAPEGATHIGMDIDMIGKGVAWIDDVAVAEGYDADAFGGKQPTPSLKITAGPELDPESADTPLSVTVQVISPIVAREATLHTEIVDYWFRPSTFEQALALEADEVRDVTVAFDEATRTRLFNMRSESGANTFRVNCSLTANGQTLVSTRTTYRFKNRVTQYEMLAALEPKKERIDDLFGEQTLIDVINCADADDPHPYIEGGRGMGAKTTGAVPNEEWKHVYREKLDSFTSIETILGKQFRVAHDWGWFGYKFNRAGLKPGTPYLVVMARGCSNQRASRPTSRYGQSLRPKSPTGCSTVSSSIRAICHTSL